MKGQGLYKEIGEKIRDLRSQHAGKGISQEALAEEMDTTANTISRWETATYKPGIGDLERLARFFGVPITVFFPGIEADRRVQALLSATSDLNDDDMEEIVRYAQFRKARQALKQVKEGRQPKP
jgi:transcriptional regulator with XRE-family HTH domain